MCRPSSTHLLPATLAIIMVAAMLCLAFSARADSDDSSILPSASGAQELGNISGSVFQDITSANLTSDDGNWTIMHPSLEDIERWDALYRRAPAAFLDLQIMHRLQSEPGASLSLLSHLQYTPSERHQGACGNCWAWAGTGVMEVALSVQKNTKDRLSIQYLNSNFYGGNGVDWACCGGWLDDVADFYKGTGKAIPWSNTNARYQDGGKSCGSGSTSVPSSSISTTPAYPIKSIQVENVPTHGMNKDLAILNIKNVLNQGKAIWFAYFLPTSADWTNFNSFWGNQPESTIWDPSFSCGQSWNSGGGHAVLCVGYDDTNRYWIMLNSWGKTSGRPGGLFRVSMDMNYDCYYYYGGYQWYSFHWQTLNMAYNTQTAPNVTNSNGASAVTANSARLNGEITSTGGENPTVHIYWGDNDGGTNPAAWDHDENLGAKPVGIFYKDISGLNRNSRYYYRCYASNSGGSDWASDTKTLDTLYQKVIGADDSACDYTESSNNIILQKFKSINDGIVDTFKVKSTASGNLKIAIYDDDSGNQGLLLGKVDTSTAVVAGWNDISFPSTALAKDRFYWLAFISDSNIVCGDYASGSMLYKKATYSGFTFPSNAGTGFTAWTGGVDLVAGWQKLPPVPPEPPIISSSNGASEVTSNSARLNGAIISAGGENPNVHIYWGDNDGGANPIDWDHDENLGIKAAGTFYKDIQGLNCGAKYYYRCFASNSAGQNWSIDTKTFYTLTQTKLIGADETACDYSESPNNIILQRFKAISNGSADTFKLKSMASGNAKVAIYDDNSGNPGSLLGKVDTSTAVAAGWNDISFPSTALVKDRFYWLAFISDSNIVCGDYTSGSMLYKKATYSGFTFPSNAGMGFTAWTGGIDLVAGWDLVPSGAPTITNSVTSTSAKLTGELVDTGGENPTVHIYWGDHDGGTNPTPLNGGWDHDENLGAMGKGVFFRELTGLNPATTYYYRSYACNSAGSVWADISESFTTLLA